MRVNKASSSFYILAHFFALIVLGFQTQIPTANNNYLENSAVVSGNQTFSPGPPGGRFYELERTNHGGVSWMNKKSQLQLHPFAKLRTPELLKARGYPVEVHQIVTLDGYILELHRIPPAPRGTRSRVQAHGQMQRLPVLLQHGNFESSVDWVLNDRDDNCLGLKLWNAGYDVWLGNFRGNLYSNKHVRYKYSGRRYWNFSAHELGIYDLAAMIDYILTVTRKPELYYIGFSLGTTSLFILLAHRPEFNQKIRLGISMGTAAYQHHSDVLRNHCRLLPVMHAVEHFYGHFPVPPPLVARTIHRLVPHLCNLRTFSIIPELCWLIWSWSWGAPNGRQVQKNKISLLLSKLPATSSSKIGLQLCQNVNRHSFSYYDYGVERNLKLYNSARPPDYNISRITAPLSILYAPADNLCVLEDIQMLVQQLPNVVDFYTVPYKQFTHIDFIFARNANELVYQHVLRLFSRLS